MGRYLSFFIKRRIVCVEIIGIEIILRYAHSVGKSLIVHDFSRAKKFYRVAHIGVVDQAKNIVIGRASLLLCYYHVFATKLSLAKVRKSI